MKNWPQNIFESYTLYNIEPVHEISNNVICATTVIFYLHILHLLLVILSPGCKAFISASPRMQWICRLVMKNSVLDSKVSSWTH